MRSLDAAMELHPLVIFLGGLVIILLNKKKLITKRRMELLTFLVNRHLDGTATSMTMGPHTEIAIEEGRPTQPM